MQVTVAVLRINMIWLGYRICLVGGVGWGKGERKRKEACKQPGWMGIRINSLLLLCCVIRACRLTDRLRSFSNYGRSFIVICISRPPAHPTQPILKSLRLVVLPTPNKRPSLDAPSSQSSRTHIPVQTPFYFIPPSYPTPPCRTWTWHRRSTAPNSSRRPTGRPWWPRPPAPSARPS